MSIIDNKKGSTMKQSLAKTLAARNFYILVAAAGLLVSLLLVWKHYSNLDLPLCSASSCDAVLSSRWSVFMGIPLALWGVLMYGILGILFTRYFKRSRGYQLSIVTMGFIVSVYLFLVSVYVIGAICYYCSISLVIISTLFGASFFLAAQKKNKNRLVGTVAGLMVIITMHSVALESNIFQKAADPQLKALATHLKAQGATFYGASWCNACQTQKEIFGSAASYLPYVECSPQGQNTPQSTVCLLKKIKSYPTWLIDGQRYERILTVEDLRKISQFPAELSDASKK